MVFVVLGVAGDAELLIEPRLRPLEVALANPRCATSRRQELWAIKDCLQVGKAQGWFLELGDHIADCVEALELGFGLHSGRGF